jgi:hypothetical protein
MVHQIVLQHGNKFGNDPKVFLIFRREPHDRKHSSVGIVRDQLDQIMSPARLVLSFYAAISSHGEIAAGFGVGDVPLLDQNNTD